MAKLILEFADRPGVGIDMLMSEEGKDGELSAIPAIRAYLEQNIEEFMRPLLGDCDPKEYTARAKVQ